MKPNYLKLAKAFLAYVVVCEIRVHRNTRKNNAALIKENQKLRDALNTSKSQTDYLLHVYNRNKIVPSEFDLIALSNLNIVPKK